MLNKADIRFAIEDARTRQSALLQLLYEIDKKSLSLLRICVTLAVATFSIAAAGINREGLINLEFILGFGIAGIGFSFAAYFCTLVIVPTDVGLPGRGPDFWVWYSKKENQTFKDAANEYFRTLEESISVNRETNQSMIKRLQRAKVVFLLSPLLGVLTTILSAATFYWLTPFQT